MIMNKSESKKALIASAAALSISAILFAGTTYAWFTDSASSAVSTIKSGNLDINLYQLVEEDDVSPGAGEGDTIKTYKAVSSSDSIFANNTNWEPGAVEVQYLKVANQGSLSLDYKLTVSAESTVGKNKSGEDIDLTKYLKAAVVPVSELQKYETRAEAVAAAEKAGAVTLADLSSYTGTLKAGDTVSSDYVAVIVYMPESVDNAANHNGKDIPSVSLGVTVEAKQSVDESDSYGNDYDTDAPYTAYSVSSSADIKEIASELKAGDVLMVTEDMTLENLSLADGVVIDGGGNTVTLANSSGINSVSGKVTLQNMTIESNGAWGLFAVQTSFDNVTFNGADPYIDPTADVVVTNCTFNKHTLQIAYQESASKLVSPDTIKTVITGNTFIVDNASNANSHAMVLNTCQGGNVEGNANFWNNFTDYVTISNNTFTATDPDSPYYAYFFTSGSDTLTAPDDLLNAWNLADNTYNGTAVAAFQSLDTGTTVTLSKSE
jgi:predicted ribosomally synthesized peptide with SipW-like signal peptide